MHAKPSKSALRSGNANAKPLHFATIIAYKIFKGYASRIDPALREDWIEAGYELLPEECLPPSPNHPAMSPDRPTPATSWTAATPSIQFGTIPVMSDES